MYLVGHVVRVDEVLLVGCLLDHDLLCQLVEVGVLLQEHLGVTDVLPHLLHLDFGLVDLLGVSEAVVVTLLLLLLDVVILLLEHCESLN